MGYRRKGTGQHKAGDREGGESVDIRVFNLVVAQLTATRLILRQDCVFEEGMVYAASESSFSGRREQSVWGSIPYLYLCVYAWGANKTLIIHNYVQYWGRVKWELTSGAPSWEWAFRMATLSHPHRPRWGLSLDLRIS